MDPNRTLIFTLCLVSFGNAFHRYYAHNKTDARYVRLIIPYLLLANTVEVVVQLVYIITTASRNGSMQESCGPLELGQLSIYLNEPELVLRSTRQDIMHDPRLIATPSLFRRP